MTEYDNTNSGALFAAANSRILRQGPVNIQGDDTHLMIVEVTTKEHKKFYEVYQKVGAIFANDDKRTENDPDMSGGINYMGLEMKIWGRKKVASQSGDKFTAISLAPKTGDSSGAYEPDDAPPSDDLEDEIPF